MYQIIAVAVGADVQGATVRSAVLKNKCLYIVFDEEKATTTALSIGLLYRFAEVHKNACAFNVTKTDTAYVVDLMVGRTTILPAIQYTTNARCNKYRYVVLGKTDAINNKIYKLYDVGEQNIKYCTEETIKSMLRTTDTNAISGLKLVCLGKDYAISTIAGTVPIFVMATDVKSKESVKNDYKIRNDTLVGVNATQVGSVLQISSEIKEIALENLKEIPAIRSLQVTANIKNITKRTLQLMPNLQEISVQTGNTRYCVKGNRLYQMGCLYYMLHANSTEIVDDSEMILSYAIKAGIHIERLILTNVKRIQKQAFRGVTIKEIEINGIMPRLDAGALSGITGLERIKINCSITKQERQSLCALSTWWCLQDYIDGQDFNDVLKHISEVVQIRNEEKVQVV
jgi:hypothetical protein